MTCTVVLGLLSCSDLQPGVLVMQRTYRYLGLLLCLLSKRQNQGLHPIVLEPPNQTGHLLGF